MSAAARRHHAGSIRFTHLARKTLMTNLSLLRTCSAGALLVGALLVGAFAPSAMAQLPPPPVPAQNPITPQKAVLGKILFWDEQLSSDNTTACGTCHINSSGGADARTGTLASRNPGPDGIPGNADDIFGTIGLMDADADDNYVESAVFGFEPQVTGRQSPSHIGAAYFNQLFWDGRASSTFTDPETGLVSIPVGGALESQAIGPPLSDVEMGHEARDWTQITTKLETAPPLKLASNLTPDIVTALNQDPTYPELFEAAFGDVKITAERIAFAIATYERTLVPNQTPFDLGTLTPGQQAGFTTFTGAGNCDACHVPPLFSGGGFRNIGVRPPDEDLGRQAITGNPADRGRFKVPSLRNVGLRDRFFHNANLPGSPMGGPANSLQAVLAFYARGGDFADNRDPLLGTTFIPGFARANVIDFLENGLTDPRVANETFPFDRPQLHLENQAANPRIFGAGVAGTGAITPRMLALSPPSLDTPGFRIGIASGLGATVAHLIVVPPTVLPATPAPVPGSYVDLRRTGAFRLGSVVLAGRGAGNGFGTLHIDTASIPARLFPQATLQWIVVDPGAPGGIARSELVELTLF